MPVLLLALLLLVPFALPSSAEAQRDRGGSRSRADTRADTRADSLFSAAQVAYEEERFEAAAELLEQAFELRPNPAFQFNLGRCYERLERWDDAERAYTIYQASVRNRAQEARAQERIEFVRRAREASRASTPVTTTTPVESEPEQTEVEVGADPLTPSASSGPSVGPFIVGGFGIAGLGVATALTIHAEDAHAQSRNAETGAEADAANRRANDYGLGATIAWIAGGTLLVAGTIWLIVELVGGTNDDSPARLSERGLELRF